MRHPPTTLDLHGRRLEDAISEVTLFLERIRRTVAASSRGRLGGHRKILYVTIITGSGSHSTHGPVLRSAVEKLLHKRGMNFTLERGGGAFRVDALSGCDLHDPGPSTESKVVLAGQDEFHQAAAARQKRNTAGSFAAMAQCTGASSGPPRRISFARSLTNQRNSDPLPSDVASEDADMRNATKLSSNETQQHRNRRKHMNNEYHEQYQNAVAESQIDYAVSSTTPAKINEEELKTALEQSAIDQQHHQQLTDKEYEDALLLAMEKSTREANPRALDEMDYEDELQIAIEKSTQETKIVAASEDDLIEQALAESRALADVEKPKISEDELLEQALAESMLEEERRKASESYLLTPADLLGEAQFFEGASEVADAINSSEDETLEKALAESLLEEEKRKSYEHGLMQEAPSKPSEEYEMLRKVMRLSVKDNEEKEISEEEAMKNAIEMSKQIR